MHYLVYQNLKNIRNLFDNGWF